MVYEKDEEAGRSTIRPVKKIFKFKDYFTEG